MSLARIGVAFGASLLAANLGIGAEGATPQAADTQAEECTPPFLPATKWMGRYASVLLKSAVSADVAAAAAGETFAVLLLIGDCPDERTEECRGAIELEIVDLDGNVVLQARNENAFPLLSNRLPGPRVTLPADLGAGCYVARVSYRSAAAGPPLLIDRGIRVVRRDSPR